MADATARKALSRRLRFDVFKRDAFTCRYCGRTSPEVVLEVDHVVPVCEGGGDDLLNLITACWDCNRGKGGRTLTEALLAEDPHERAMVLLEREQQLREYNEVLRIVRERKEQDVVNLMAHWENWGCAYRFNNRDIAGLMHLLDEFPYERLHEFIDICVAQRCTSDLRYFYGIVRKMRGEAA